MKRKVTGLIPAAGFATRLDPLPCSKEVFPIGFHRAGSGRVRSKVAGEYLLEKMQAAGVRKAYIVIREGKWDIPAYFADGTRLGLSIAYLMMNQPYGAPFTLAQACPFVRNEVIVFGFPDILFQPEDAFSHLLDKLARTNSDVVLGLFPTTSPERMDTVEIDEDGRVRNLFIKSSSSQSTITWIAAVWSPRFTAFLQNFVNEAVAAHAEEVMASREWYVGEVIQEAIDNGLYVESVVFPEGECIDIGTPYSLMETMRVETRLP